jgi:tripartite ATP-independent transporter DctM subunit
MMQKMMTHEGRYPASFAAALTASSAVIGPIIPPSIPVVLYALISDASIGYLFLAGVVPGLIMGLMQMGIIVSSARRRKFPVEEPVPLRELPGVTLRAFPALMMPVVLLGGIYSGVTTPTEAAAIAAAYAFLISALLYRSVTLRSIYASLLSSARTTASIGMLIAGALVFNYVVTVENIPNALRAFLAGYELSPIAFLLMVNVILLVLGCLLEGTTILLIVVPVFVGGALCFCWPSPHPPTIHRFLVVSSAHARHGAVWLLASSNAPRGITIRSSRTRFVTPNTWQKELAMCSAPLHGSA